MKYKILGIAPYEALKNTMLKLAEARNDIELEVLIGDMEDGVQIALEHEQDGYDAIISRGGTAMAIRKATALPVIDISLSVYDILRAIRLAENYQQQFAIVGFPVITETAHLLCDLLEYRIQIVTIYNQNEAEPALRKLQEQGCHMVICDMVTQNTAKLLNMSAILMLSGAESIITAFDQAVNFCRSYYTLREENSFLRSILEENGSYTIVMSEDHSVFLSTCEAEEEEEIINQLQKELPHILSGGDRKFFRTIGRTLYSVTSRTSSYKEKKYVVFYFTASKIPMNLGKYGIRFCDKEDVEKEYYNSFFNIAGVMGSLAAEIDDLARSSYPIMIHSEEGTGKKYIAGLIYVKSELSSNPLIIIDCSMLNERNWEYFINHYNSPINDNGNTIYFRSAEALSPQQHKKLLSVILDTNLHKRNRLLFSTRGSSSKETSDYLLEYVKRLSCATVAMAPLRNRQGEIPSLASLYLSHLNLELGKQIMGLEPAAMNILKNFEWPSNFIQFKRILMEAATLTAGFYVTADTVADLIESEQASSAYYTLFQGGSSQKLPEVTLEHMVSHFIQKTLEDNGGNQSKTAKQLDISRSTLWRYLNKGKNA